METRITCGRCGKPKTLVGAAAAQHARSEAKGRRILEEHERRRRAAPLNSYSRAIERRTSLPSMPADGDQRGLRSYDRALARRATGGAR